MKITDATKSKVLSYIKKHDGETITLSYVASEFGMKMKGFYQVMLKLREEGRIRWIEKTGRQLPDRILYMFTC